MSDVEPKYRVVVMGKTGSGKSSVCNRLIGRDDDNVFTEYSGMGGRTTQIKSHKAFIDSKCIEVVDTPDFFYMGHNNIDSARADFRAWDEAGPLSIPTIILVTVPMGVRFSSEDKILYNEKYINILPVEYHNNLIIICTKMETFVGSVEHRVQELHTLQNLWDAAEGRHIEFRGNADAQQLQRDLIAMLDAMKLEDRIARKSAMRMEESARKNTTVQELNMVLVPQTETFAQRIVVLNNFAPGLITQYVASLSRRNPKLVFATLVGFVLYSVVSLYLKFIQSPEENVKLQAENQTDFEQSL